MTVFGKQWSGFGKRRKKHEPEIFLSHTEIEGLVLVKPFVAYDVRGYFLKDYSEEVFAQKGIRTS